MDTKEKRVAARVGQIQYHVEHDHGAHETYRGIQILIYAKTYGERTHYTLQAWKGTSYKPFANFYYTSEESRVKAIATLKGNEDYNQERKTERAKEPKELSGQAKAAALIRAELKQGFPTVKFRVTSSSFSMGDDVNIHWDLGPTTKQVEAVTNKYQNSGFDSMTDCSYSVPVTTAASSKYVMTQRDNPFHDQMCEDYAKAMNITYTGTNTRVENHNEYLSTLLHRLLGQFDLTKHGYQGIARTDFLGAGDMSDFYVFTGAKKIERY